MGSQGQTKVLQPIPSNIPHHVLLARSTAMPGDPVSLPSIRAWKIPPSLASNIGVKRRRSGAVSWGTPRTGTVTPPPPSSSPRLLPAMVVSAATANPNSSNDNDNDNSNNSTRFQAQWLYFSNYRWIPLDRQNHHKLERTLELGGVFADIQDSHFPGVQRIRVFPRADYLSYLGVRYRISRVLLPPL